ncbi:SAM-dependent methyltransferase [Nocardia aurea]|uniref:SAM-dependent methyltransferase n=1 Tax=Nocardia aurea TaxID=2144174 RepID=UPI0033B580B0
MAEDQVPMAGVAMTAVGVAVIRATESERADRLYDDPLARDFVAAARLGFEGTEDGRARWARVEALAAKFFDGRSLTVRVIDDEIVRAVDNGCSQLVLFGAGLDTRAYRMALPARVRLFEIDLPELFAFKEPILAAAGATATCTRQVVAADLRADWVSALVASGYRADLPAHWVDEGVLDYLPHADALRLAEWMTEISAPASSFALGRFDVAPQRERYAELGRLVGATASADRRGLGPDGERWLAEHGWRTRFHPWDDLVESFGRPEMAGGSAAGLVRAVRLP